MIWVRNKITGEAKFLLCMPNDGAHEPCGPYGGPFPKLIDMNTGIIYDDCEKIPRDARTRIATKEAIAEAERNKDAPVQLYICRRCSPPFCFRRKVTLDGEPHCPVCNDFRVKLIEPDNLDVLDRLSELERRIADHGRVLKNLIDGAKASVQE